MSLKTWSESKKPSISQSTPSPYLQPHHNNSTSPACQLQVGDKVQVNSLHGIVRFIGPTKFKAGTWAGIELDAVGLGKNDGSVDG
jgi:hypothetical protein